MKADGTTLLVIDTSFVGISCALWSVTEKKEIWFEALPHNQKTASALTTILGHGFSKAQIDVGSLKGIIAGVGPGSFTGIKIGLGFLYGLLSGMAPSLRPSILGLSGLEALATSLGKPVLLPQTRTHGFLARPGDQSQLITVQTVAGMLGGEECCVFGPWTELQSLEGIVVTTLDPEAALKAATVAMAEHGLAVWPHGFSHSIPEPKYLRLSTAEERIIEQQGKEVIHGS